MAKTPQKVRVLFYFLAAALPLFIVASIFNYSLLRGNDHYLLGANLEILGYIIQAEFLAVASGILILIPLLVHTESKYLRWLLYVIFIGLAGAFSWNAYEVDGPAGMVFYSLLVFVSYGGGTLLIFDWYAGATRTFLSLLRWSTGIFLYVSLQLSFNLESDISLWKNTRSVIPFGASYFYLLSLLELVLYTPLTYYLEKKHSQDKVLSKGIDSLLKKTDHRGQQSVTRTQKPSPQTLHSGTSHDTRNHQSMALAGSARLCSWQQGEQPGFHLFLGRTDRQRCRWTLHVPG